MMNYNDVTDWHAPTFVNLRSSLKTNGDNSQKQPFLEPKIRIKLVSRLVSFIAVLAKGTYIQPKNISKRYYCVNYFK